MEKYSHRERLQMIIAGETPDRYAASFWRHFFHMEHTAEGTVEAMLAYQKEFDWDFMKLNTRADYHQEDWGFEQEWSHDEFKKHAKTRFPITDIDDWAKLTPNEPTAPSLAEHLKVVSMIRKKSDPELPILMTLFTPLAIAGRMVKDRQVLVEHLRQAPEKVEKGLRAITDTFVKYASELRNAGADGLFFATLQWASSDLLTWEEYQRFGVPYDLEVVRAAESDAMNLLHVCAGYNYLKELSGIKEYNASMYNWDACDPTNLPLDQAYDALQGKAFVGGIDQTGWLLRSDAEEVAYLTDVLKDKHQKNRLIIGPGCVVEPETPSENLHIIRERL